jgi:hypothetical protein
LTLKVQLIAVWFPLQPLMPQLPEVKITHTPPWGGQVHLMSFKQFFPGAGMHNPTLLLTLPHWQQFEPWFTHPQGTGVQK